MFLYLVNIITHIDTQTFVYTYAFVAMHKIDICIPICKVDIYKSVW